MKNPLFPILNHQKRPNFPLDPIFGRFFEILNNINMEEKSIFKRDIEADMLKWMERREAYAIKGPRQSGKTTLLRIMEGILRGKGGNTAFLNFEDLDVLEAFEGNPGEYVRSFMVKGGRNFFLMDECHYVKDPGKKLKLLYDTFEDAKFMVTGSSSLELGGAMAKFLVGRVFFFELFPFSFHEFLAAKDSRLAKIYEEKHGSVMAFLRGAMPRSRGTSSIKSLRESAGLSLTEGIGYVRRCLSCQT